MDRKVDMSILKAWAKTKMRPQLQLALDADIAPKTVLNVFQGQCPPRARTRKKIASAIGVDEDVLFPETDEAETIAS